MAPEWALRWAERGLGGFTLFAYNVGDRRSWRRLTARLREAGDLLLAIDEEGGDVTRLEADRGSSYPGNLALGAVDDPALTADVAAAIAGDVARAGVNLNFAPVADVNVEPRQPGDRRPQLRGRPRARRAPRRRVRRGDAAAGGGRLREALSRATATPRSTRTSTCPS